MSYEPRFYRNRMGENRFHSFMVGYKDSDLWIGIDKASFHPDMPAFAQKKLIELRKELEQYILTHPEFASSYTPIDTNAASPQIAIQMSAAGKIAETGPMAAVAGAFSEFLGKAIQHKFEVKEIVIENGGDIYLLLEQNMILSVYAGESSLSGKIGIEIPAKETPLGVCTSAGTVGPSTSFGNADAVMVAAKNTALADALATSIGNKIKSANDINPTLELMKTNKSIKSLLIICENKMGITGDFELRLCKI